MPSLLWNVYTVDSPRSSAGRLEHSSSATVLFRCACCSPLTLALALALALAIALTLESSPDPDPNPKQVRVLLAAGASPNLTPHLNPNPKQVRVLLAAGANPAAVCDGQTPLHFAAMLSSLVRVPPLGGARGRLPRLLRARLAALAGLTLPRGRSAHGWLARCPATASGARS